MKQEALYLHKNHNVFAVALTDANTTAKVTVFTPGADDSDLHQLTLTSDM